MDHIFGDPVPADPWGRPSLYSLDAGHQPVIRSYGSDGQPGGELFAKDISSTRLWEEIPQTRRERLAAASIPGMFVISVLMFAGCFYWLIRES